MKRSEVKPIGSLFLEDPTELTDQQLELVVGGMPSKTWSAWKATILSGKGEVEQLEMLHRSGIHGYHCFVPGGER